MSKAAPTPAATTLKTTLKPRDMAAAAAADRGRVPEEQLHPLLQLHHREPALRAATYRCLDSFNALRIYAMLSHNVSPAEIERRVREAHISRLSLDFTLLKVLELLGARVPWSSERLARVLEYLEAIGRVVDENWFYHNVYCASASVVHPYNARRLNGWAMCTAVLEPVFSTWEARDRFRLKFLWLRACDDAWAVKLGKGKRPVKKERPPSKKRRQTMTDAPCLRAFLENYPGNGARHSTQPKRNGSELVGMVCSLL